MDKKEIQKIVLTINKDIKKQIERQTINNLLDMLNPNKDKDFESEYTKQINISPIINFLRILYYVDEDSKNEDGDCDVNCLSDLAVFEDEPFSALLDRLEGMEITIDKDDLQ